MRKTVLSIALLTALNVFASMNAKVFNSLPKYEDTTFEIAEIKYPQKGCGHYIDFKAQPRYIKSDICTLKLVGDGQILSEVIVALGDPALCNKKVGDKIKLSLSRVHCERPVFFDCKKSFAENTFGFTPKRLACVTGAQFFVSEK